MDEKDLIDRLSKNPSLRKKNQHLFQGAAAFPSPIPTTPAEIKEAADAMLEDELQAELRKKALAAGWLYYHTHDSRKSDSGFLDTVMLRVGIRCDLLFIECKREGESPSKDQQRWIKALEVFIKYAKGFAGLPVTMEVHVWYPTDLLSGTIAERLTRL